MTEQLDTETHRYEKEAAEVHLIVFDVGDGPAVQALAQRRHLFS